MLMVEGGVCNCILLLFYTNLDTRGALSSLSVRLFYVPMSKERMRLNNSNSDPDSDSLVLNTNEWE